MSALGYAELCCVSGFSFQRGASTPEELVARAAELGYRAIALTDECSLAGAVRALQTAEACAIDLILGSRFTLDEGVMSAIDEALNGVVEDDAEITYETSPKKRLV